MIPAREEAKRLLDLALRATRADGCTVLLSGHDGGHVRFARGEPTTAGVTLGFRLTVRCSFGSRSGVFTTSQLGPDSIESAVRSAEALGRFAPEDPEFLPPPGPQTYLPVEGWSSSTAECDPARRAGLVRAFLEGVGGRGVAAGLCDTAAHFSAIASSSGLFGWHRGTNASLAGTARTEDGAGSGWAGAVATTLEPLDARALGSIAAEKAAASRSPQSLPPGRYTVVLEPAAVADLLPFLPPVLDARRTDEGRTPFSRQGGAGAPGDRVMAAGVTLRSDPAAASAPSIPFDAEGSAYGKTVWVEAGVLKDLWTSRYWARKTGAAHLPAPASFLMGGGPDSIESMVQKTSRGLLVTRFWYIRLVDPQTLLLTGLTRDGLFLIEKGRITGSVRNFRFNESPLAVLAKADMIGRARRFGAGSDRGGLVIEAPPVRSHEFNFTSTSEAV